MTEKFVVIETIAPEECDTVVSEDGPLAATFPIRSEPVDTQEEAEQILESSFEESWHSVASIEV